MFSLFSKSTNKVQGGFTLIELLVSVGVLTIITAIVLANHARFGGDLLLSNLAYDIALSIRQSQSYGLSVREVGTGTGFFDTGYGVYFAENAPTSYVLFADRDKDGLYDGGAELVEAYTLGRGNTIQSFCGVLSSGVEKCVPLLSFLSVVFIRPDPDAIIKSSISGDTYSSARIVVQSPQGTQREVNVEVTGQISVE